MFQEKIDELCGDIQRYSGGGKLFFVLKTNNSERMIHQQCVYNYYKNSKSKIAFSIYRTLLHTASGLGKHLDEYNQFENNLTDYSKLRNFDLGNSCLWLSWR